MNAYQILGVSRDVSSKDLKQAHRRLISQFHPNKFLLQNKQVGVLNECDARLDICNKTFKYLENGNRRAQYDNFLYNQEKVDDKQGSK